MASRRRATTFPGEDHDHEACVDAAMARAASRCAAAGARLTPLRSRVLEIVWSSHRPLGAYAILEVLAEEGRSPAPPTVYRALDFLLEHALVHRLASLNAFIGCSEPGHGGRGQFLICRSCGSAAELNDRGIEDAIEASVARRKFFAHSHTVEVSGLCPHCRPS